MKRGNPEGPYLATALGNKASRRPTWIMRQAGRYLPEYREIRSKLSFLELCKTPEAAAEVTMQPVRRYDMDAAILFTDLLVPIEPMGLDLRYEPGPVIENTVSSRADVDALTSFDPSKELTPMLDTVRLVRKELDEDKALIGFVGAPFTMACYMIKGRGSKNWDKARSMMHGDPKTFDALLAKTAECLSPLIGALVEAGCDAIQIFDSWASALDSDDYATLCAPHTDTLLETPRDTGAIAINYVNGASQHIERMAESKAQVLGIDWRTPMAQARARIPASMTIQGNLDPTALFCDEATLRRKVKTICDAAGSDHHIFNLGHGILPSTDPKALEYVLDEVRKS